MSELRKDFLLDRCVIIAKERSKRPTDFISKPDIRDERKVCFFCPGNEHLTPPEISRIEENEKWVIRNFPNKFPATKFHEIIVETPKHKEEFSDLKVERIVKVFKLFSERVKKIMSEDKKVKYVLMFKNQGEIAGASLEHSHTQLIGLEIIPTLIQRELEGVKKYSKGKKRKKCIFCDLIIKKESSSERKVFEDAHSVAFTPYASRFPFEIWLMPKKHRKNLDEFSKEEIYSFAKMLKKILMQLNSFLNKPPYNFYLHISPKKEDLHLHLELFPRHSKLAGFEFGSDVIINVMPPEDAAKYYRKEKI